MADINYNALPEKTTASVSWDKVLITDSENWDIVSIQEALYFKWPKWDQWDQGTPWTWDVVWPASVVNNNFASFDTTTWKLIKDSWLNSSSFAPALWVDDNYVTDAEKIVISNTSWVNTWDQNSNTVIAERISWSTYSTVQHMQDLFHSSGWTSWGVISDAWGWLITVTAWTWLIRATDSDVAVIKFTDFPASSPANVVLTDWVDNYIYVEYNAWSPRTIATTSLRTDYNTNFRIWNVYRDWTNVHINQTDKIAVSDHAWKMIRFNQEVMPYAHSNWGMIMEMWTRQLMISAWSFWNWLIKFTTSEFDSSASWTFNTWYVTWSTWTKTTAQTTLWNTQYNNTTTWLATLSNNKYWVYWVYLWTDSDVNVVYWQGDYTLTQAQDAWTPATLPNEITSHSFICWKIIILKSATNFTQIESAFSMWFTWSLASDHNNLAWLQGWASNQYYHLTSAEYTWTWTWNFVRAISPTLVTPILWTPTSWTLTNCTWLPITWIIQSTWKLLWRNTVWSWAVEEITLGTWLSMTWSTLNASTWVDLWQVYISNRIFL